MRAGSWPSISGRPASRRCNPESVLFAKRRDRDTGRRFGVLGCRPGPLIIGTDADDEWPSILVPELDDRGGCPWNSCTHIPWRDGEAGLDLLCGCRVKKQWRWWVTGVDSPRSAIGAPTSVLIRSNSSQKQRLLTTFPRLSLTTYGHSRRLRASLASSLPSAAAFS